jgi:hypothetical protein
LCADRGPRIRTDPDLMSQSTRRTPSSSGRNDSDLEQPIALCARALGQEHVRHLVHEWSTFARTISGSTLRVNVDQCEETHTKEEAKAKEQLLQEFAEAYEQLIETASLAAQRGVTRRRDRWGPREIVGLYWLRGISVLKSGGK